MRKAIALVMALCLISPALVQAQQPAPATPRAIPRGPYTLQQQFNSMKSRSSSYTEFNHDYKVVRVSSLDAFWKHVQDSLIAREQNIRKAGKATANSLQQAQKTMAEQNAQIQLLKQENARKDAQIQQSSHDVASLSVFGLDMNKQVYVILSWLVILTLGVLVGMFAFLYKKSKRVTDEKIKAYDEITQEFKEHKQNARERETKVKRDLQTESNRVEELNQQLAQLKKQVSL